jgi:hypothetical protein
LIVKRVSIVVVVVVVVVVVPLGAEPTVTELLFGTAISTPAGVTTSMKKNLVAVFFFLPPVRMRKKSQFANCACSFRIDGAPHTHKKKCNNNRKRERKNENKWRYDLDHPSKIKGGSLIEK